MSDNNKLTYELIADQLDNINQLLYLPQFDQSTRNQIAMAIATIIELIQELT